MKIKLPNQLCFHCDGGHGWLAVKRQLLHDLGIAEAISSYSYQKGQTVYLEEDCDMACFYDALELSGFSKEEIEARIKKSYRDMSPIRHYASYAHESGA